MSGSHHGKMVRPKTFTTMYVGTVAVLACFYCFVYPRLQFADHVLFNSLIGEDRSRVQSGDNCLRNVVTVNNGGRLANKIFEYASVWSVAKTYGFRPFVPTSIHRALRDVFEELSVPPLGMLVEELQERKDGRCNRTLSEAAILKGETTDNELYPMDEYVQNAQAAGKPIVLRRWIVLTDTIIPLVQQLRREFRYRTVYLLAAYRTLARTRQHMMRRPNRVGDQVIHVGVHVRRQDYHLYLRRRFGVEVFAEVPYYLHAMAWMRSMLSADARGPVNVAFVVVSDDPRWCYSTLIPALHRSGIPSGPTLGSFGVFYGGQGGIGRPGYDLALLSSCQHSIISYGTFGMWTAMMAGGKTSVYDIRAKNSMVTEKNAAMQFAEKLNNWVALV